MTEQTAATEDTRTPQQKAAEAAKAKREEARQQAAPAPAVSDDQLEALRESLKAELLAQLASERATDPAVPGSTPADVVPEGGHLIHFVEDGWTAFGQVWYKGQELLIMEGSEHWTHTIDPGTGQSWLTMDEDEQLDAFDTIFFKPGPWKGRGYGDVRFDDQQIDERLVGAAAAQKERERRRQPPPLVRV